MGFSKQDALARRTSLVTLKVAEKWFGLSTTRVRDIPNFFVLRTLAEHLRQPGQRSPVVTGRQRAVAVAGSARPDQQ
jgi:hypothetical protein